MTQRCFSAKGFFLVVIDHYLSVLIFYFTVIEKYLTVLRCNSLENFVLTLWDGFAIVWNVRKTRRNSVFDLHQKKRLLGQKPLAGLGCCPKNHYLCTGNKEQLHSACAQYVHKSANGWHPCTICSQKLRSYTRRSWERFKIYESFHRLVVLIVF